MKPQHRYTFTRADLDAWTPSMAPASPLPTNHRPLTTVPWYWTLYALGLGGLAGVVFMVVLLVIFVVPPL